VDASVFVNAFNPHEQASSPADDHRMVYYMVMIKTNVADAKARLSEYLDRAIAGERIVICRHNTPIVELRAIEDAPTTPRPIGPLPGRPAVHVPTSFFEPLPDRELDAWEGRLPPARGVGPSRSAARATATPASSGVQGHTRRRRGRRQ
jgi:prevent-host-death family protein